MMHLRSGKATEKLRYPAHYVYVTRAAVVLLLAGCSFAPDHVRPPMPVPTTWTSPEDHGASVVPHLTWRQFFRNPSLQAQIETALNNNRDLRMTVARVEGARSLYRIQRSGLYPHLTGEAGAGRLELPGNIPFVQSGGVGEFTENLFVGLLNASWEVDLWGRVRNLSEAALEQWLASDEARRAVMVSLIAEVANNWLEQRELDERIALARKTIDTRRESVRITRRRYEVGASPRIDLTQAETLLGEAESEAVSLEQQREETRNAMSVLLGVPAKQEVTELSSVENSVTPDLPPGLPSDMLENRPDIREAEDNLRSAEADIGAARAAFFPQIGLTGAFGDASPELDNLFASGSRLWWYGGLVKLPLFEGGALTGNLARAKAERQMAIADYERTVQAAFRDVADSLTARRWLAQKIDAERMKLAALTDRAHLAELRYSNGSTNYLEVLDAQRDLFSSQETLVAVRRARLSSEVNLYASLGGGDDYPKPSTAENAPQDSWWLP